MSKSGLFLSMGALREAPEDVLRAIYNLAGLPNPGVIAASRDDDVTQEANNGAVSSPLVVGESAAGEDDEVEVPSAYVMDPSFARRFLETCSNKTRKTLSVIIGKNGTFEYDSLEAEVGVGPLRGVWTGLTNRLRKLSGNPDAKLFDWEWPDDLDGSIGKMAPATVAAFRKAL